MFLLKLTLSLRLQPNKEKEFIQKRFFKDKTNHEIYWIDLMLKHQTLVLISQNNNNI